MGLRLDFGGRLRDFQRSRQENMRSNGASQETIGNIAYHHFLVIVPDKGLMESVAGFHHGDDTFVAISMFRGGRWCRFPLPSHRGLFSLPVDKKCHTMHGNYTKEHLMAVGSN